MKDWLSYEQSRNKQHAALYSSILKHAGVGADAVLVGHHIGFETGGNIDTENEIPSADTLIFDHQIMGAVFGTRAVAIMAELATLPCDKRDARLQEFYNQRFGYVNAA